MTSRELDDIMHALGATWQVGYWLVPERRPDGLILSKARWSPEGGFQPEHGVQRGFIFDPVTIRDAGLTPLEPILAVEEIEDAIEAQRAGFAAISRPYFSQGFEGVASLVEGRHTVVVAGPTVGRVLAGSALCAKLELSAATVGWLPVPSDHEGLAAWLRSSADPAALLRNQLGQNLQPEGRSHD